MSQTVVAPPAPSDAPRPRPKHKGFAAHAKLISALTLVSRILGLLRETVSATYFGADNAVSQAFITAFSIPNLFRKLLGEGALSAAFIPLYSQALKKGDEEEANRFAAASVNFLFIVLLSLTIVGELLLWVLPQVVAFRAANLLAVKYTAIMLPYVLLVCGTAFLGGILQVHRRFGLPALTQVPLNVVHIVVIIFGARLLHMQPGRPDEALQTKLAYWLSFLVLVAGGMQIAMLVPALRAVGFRPMWIGKIWTPAVKKMVILSIPVALSAGVLQISVVVDKVLTLYLTGSENPADKLHWFGHILSYPLEMGAATRLYWAQFLYQFPLGVFATAVATAMFPRLSAEAHDKDNEQFKRVLRQGIIFTLLEGLPASIGLILVRYPAVRFVYQHGNFTPRDTQWVALSVVFYSSAIWAFSLQQIMNRAYYALHDMKTPLLLSVVTILVNTIVEVPLCFTKLGEAGMAAGTLASFAAQGIVMLILLDRRVGGLGMKSILISTAKMLIACAAMAAVVLAIQHIPGFPRSTGQLASLIQLVIMIVSGGATYAAVCYAMGFRKGNLG